MSRIRELGAGRAGEKTPKNSEVYRRNPPFYLDARDPGAGPAARKLRCKLQTPRFSAIFDMHPAAHLQAPGLLRKR